MDPARITGGSRAGGLRPVATSAVGALAPARLATGLVVALLSPPLTTAALLATGDLVDPAGHALVFLLDVVLTALVGGMLPALVAAVVAMMLLNFYFIEPLHTLRISEPHDVTSLVVFLVAAVLVGAVVHRAALLSARAARSSAEANTLAAVAGGIIGGEEALPALLEELRTAFGMSSVALLSSLPVEASDSSRARWQVEASKGEVPPARPEEADVVVAGGDDLVLALSGRPLLPSDRQVLGAFAAQAQGLLERDRLAREAARADQLAAADRLRNALLAALGHDLRTPLASATAAVSSLRSHDVQWSPQEQGELLLTADRSLHRLGVLITDLLDLSRLQAGVLAPIRQPVWLDELVGPALAELGPDADPVLVDVPDDLAPALADGALALRVLVNLLGNALQHSPRGRPPLVSADADDESVRLRVIDVGPGVTPADKEIMFRPFQRLGDTDNTTGLGLGLALSRGLVEAMDGDLAAYDTPGGGLTMVLRLPRAHLDDEPLAPEQD